MCEIVMLETKPFQIVRFIMNENIFEGINTFYELRKKRDLLDVEFKKRMSAILKEKNKYLYFVKEKFNIEKDKVFSPYIKDVDIIFRGIISYLEDLIQITNIELIFDDYTDANALIKLKLSRPVIDKEEGEYFAENWEYGEIVIIWNDEGYIKYAERKFEWDTENDFKYV